MKYLEIINCDYSNKLPENIQRFTDRINNAPDFNKALEDCHDDNKIPVFTKVHITNGVLESRVQSPIFEGLGKEIVLDNVVINFEITNRTMPERSLVHSSTFNKSLYQNIFQRINFNSSIFNEAVIAVDFQQAILNDVTFNETVSDCNFINSHLENTQFTKKVTGFTCFSGANLEGARFDEGCDNTVIFIGSNLPMPKPIGGIKTVSELEQALKEKQYTDEQAQKLYEIISLAHDEVAQLVDNYSHVEYHINQNDLDHLSRAKDALSTYLGLSNHSGVFIINVMVGTLPL